MILAYIYAIQFLLFFVWGSWAWAFFFFFFFSYPYTYKYTGYRRLGGVEEEETRGFVFFHFFSFKIKGEKKKVDRVV